MGTYTVTGPLVLATTTTGRVAYVYQGANLPDDVSTEEAKRLVDTGLVEHVADEKPAAKRGAKD